MQSDIFHVIAEGAIATERSIKSLIQVPNKFQMPKLKNFKIGHSLKMRN